MKEKFNLSSWAIAHQQLVSFLMLTIVAIGWLSYQALPRDEDPGFTIKTAVVSVQWPGATVDDTVNHVTDLVEKTAQTLPWIDNVESQTRQGNTEVTINLRDETPPDQVKPVWALLRHKMHDLAATLPEGASEPVVNDEYDATWGTIYGFTGDGFNEEALRQKALAVQKTLQDVPDLGRSLLLGVQNKQITMHFSARKLAAMGIDPQEIVSAMRNQNAVATAADLRTGKDIIGLHISGDILSLSQLENTLLTIKGKQLPLASLVTFTENDSLVPQPAFHVNGKPAIGLALSMAPGGNMLAFGKALDAKIAAARADLPVGMAIITVANQREIVKEAIGGFMHVLAEAIVIVLAVSFVSLGMRAGLVVAIAIPLVLALTFTGMALAGIGLQRISLGALIIALGLLVDDAMITIESMVTRLEQGESLKRAAASAFISTAFPMLTGTLVMIAGFIPVGFAKSMAGEYCYSLFMVVLISLLSSWLVAVLFSPLSGIWILPKKIPHHQENGRFVSRAYSRLLDFALANRGKVTLASVLLLVFALWSSQWLKSEFFPASDRPELLLSLTLPESATQAQTQKVVHRLEQIIDKEKTVASYSSYIGTGAIRFYLPMDIQSEAENTAQLVIVAHDLHARNQLQQQLTNVLNNQFSDYVTRLSPLELGPPVGWPVKYRIKGPDFTQVRILAEELRHIVASASQISNVNLTGGMPRRQIEATPNIAAARAVGLGKEEIYQAMHLFYSGEVVATMRQPQRLVDIVLQGDPQEREDLASIKSFPVSYAADKTIPLSQIAQISWKLTDPMIQRRNGLPSIQVQADVTTGSNVDEVIASLDKPVSEFSRKLPKGYHIRVEGEAEDADKGNSSLYAVLPVTLVCMLGIMMIQLQSYARVLLAVAMVPFGFIGVAGALLPTGMPIGFVAILGVIALSGMIMRNAVMLISEVDENLKQGGEAEAAIKRAAMHRARPVALTACAAICGMIPISRQIFWGPMACAIIGGLTAATFFTLTLLPVLLSWLIKLESKAGKETDRG